MPFEEFVKYFENPPGDDVLAWRRLLTESGLGRGGDVLSSYHSLDLDTFAKDRFQGKLIYVLDYGAGTWGAAGLLPAAAVDAEKIVFVGGGSDIALKGKKGKMEVYDSGAYELPDLGNQKFEMVELNDVVSWMGDRKRCMELLQQIADSMTKDGIGIIVQTDREPWKMQNVLENHAYILSNLPDLLSKFVFVVPDDERGGDKSLKGKNGDLAEQIEIYRTKLHDKEFVIESITERK